MIAWLKRRPKQALLMLIAGLLLGVGSLAGAQTHVFEISWWTVASGGDMFSSGGAYSLGGSAGQAAAGEPMSGGSYTSQGGFWVIPAQIPSPSPSPTPSLSPTPLPSPSPTPPATGIENNLYLPVVITP